MDLGREYLDPGICRAFAVADHQIANIYVHKPEYIPEIKSLFKEITGIERVLDRAGKREFGIDHERSGELVLIAEKDAWFTFFRIEPPSKRRAIP